MTTDTEMNGAETEKQNNENAKTSNNDKTKSGEPPPSEAGGES